jgi:TPR repeat protein
MKHLVAGLFVGIASCLVLFTGTSVTGQSDPQMRRDDRPVIGVYFDEPFKLLEPFEKDFRRSCSCVENAFALIPRIVEPPFDASSPVRPLRLSEAVLQAIRDAHMVGLREDWIFGGKPSPRLLMTGIGTPPLEPEAAIAAGVQAYLQLAQNGESEAQAHLGYLFAVGLGVPQDDQAAAYWYGQAALQNWPDATVAVAAMYAIGRGVLQDDRAAFVWLLHSQRMQLLADAYACGLGVEQDFEHARQLYEVMADRSSQDAQYQLGTMYLNGCGAPLNDEVASKWFEKAAQRGHPEAQIALSDMSTRGWSTGVPDPGRGLFWAEVALTRLHGDEPSRALALAALDRAAAMLTSEQQADVLWAVRTLIDTDAEGQADGLKSFRAELKVQK